jgi:hypothetical protein
MKRLILIIAMTCSLGLFACSEDDGGGNNGDGSNTTAESVCGKIFECFDSNWGFDTEESCAAEFLDGCSNSSGYLGCSAACVAGACDAFESCEPDCYSTHCE